MHRRTAVQVMKMLEDDLRAIEIEYFGGRCMFDIEAAKLTDEPDDSLHIGRLDSATAALGLLAATRALSDRAVHYFDEAQRLRQALQDAQSQAAPPPLTPNS